MELIIDEQQGLETQAAENIASLLANMAKEGTRDLLLALSGGSSPRSLYGILSDIIPETLARRISIIQVDERVVQPNHIDSNQNLIRMSCKHLIEKGATFYSVKVGEAKAKELYNEKISVLMKTTHKYIPAVAILGIGLDGHTASIFPNEPEHRNPSENSYAFETEKSYDGYYRISLTFHTLLLFRNIVFFTPGSRKKEVLETVLEESNKSYFPASWIMHQHRNVSVYASN